MKQEKEGNIGYLLPSNSLALASLSELNRFRPEEIDFVDQRRQLLEQSLETSDDFVLQALAVRPWNFMELGLIAFDQSLHPSLIEFELRRAQLKLSETDLRIYRFLPKDAHQLVYFIERRTLPSKVETLDEREALVDQHFKKFYDFIATQVRKRLPEDVDEIVSEVFVREFKAKRLDFIDELNPVIQESRIRSWLARTATNLCVDKARRNRIIEFKSLEEWEGYVFVVTENRFDNPHAMMMTKELQSDVRMALARIPEKQRRVLTSFEYDGLSYAEIAKVIGTTPGTIKTLISRAREKFRREYRSIANNGRLNGVI